MSNTHRDETTAHELPEVRIGISACLLGRNVRVNGGHCRDRWLTDVLAPYVTWVAVCPEVEMGMSTPRPPMRLVTDGETTRLVMSEGGEDRTAEMDAYATTRIEALTHEGLHGYVLKKDSPSCGLFRVKVYDRNSSPSRTGRGVFAAHLAERFPLLPIEEEGRLNDPVLRENFVVRAFTFARWTHYRAHDASPAGFVRFHTVHKTLVLTHDPNTYGEMGRLVARAGEGDASALHDTYGALMMKALAQHASRGRHVNALQHLSGFVKDDLGADEKRELGRLLAEYRGGFVPLVVPLTLVRHLIRHHAPGSWADQQIYLEPYAARLMLRNAV